MYLDDPIAEPDIVLVVGGTRKIYQLWRLQRRGTPILYRLDGIQWLHRKRWYGVSRFVSAEIRNALMKFIHAYLADYVVYQSKFVERWWEQSGWRNAVPSTVIHNGVDLDQFKPLDSAKNSSKECVDVLCIEGNIDYSPFAIETLNALAGWLAKRDIRLILYGAFADPENASVLLPGIDYKGEISRECIHDVYRNTVYVSLDINAACPNTVVEAMSSGAPVVGFRTGALPELVPDTCGSLADYGSDPWDGREPNTESLFHAIEDVSKDYVSFSDKCRAHAQAHFDIQVMAERYLDVLYSLVEKSN